VSPADELRNALFAAHCALTEIELGKTVSGEHEWSVRGLVEMAHATAREKGWHDPEHPRTIPELLCLVHSEVSEALEAYRDPDREICVEYEVDGKPEGVPSELADVVIRVADVAGLLGIDLEGAIRRKLAYNKTRPQRHGGKRA